MPQSTIFTYAPSIGYSSNPCILHALDIDNIITVQDLIIILKLKFIAS